MKIQVLRENIKPILNALVSIAPKKSTLPVLQNILIQADDDGIRVSATDLEIAATMRVGGKVLQDGAITLPAPMLNDFVNDLQNGVITIETDETERAHISLGKSRATIAGIEADEYPNLPAIDAPALTGIDGDAFKSAVNRVVFCTSSETARPVLTGVHLLVSDTLVMLEAADGYRYSQANIELPEPGNYGNFIVPANAMRKLAALITPDDVVEIISIDEGSRVGFRFGSVQVISRTIAGTFPDVASIMPAHHDSHLVLNTAEIARMVKLANPFHTDSQALYLDYDGADALEVRTRVTESGVFDGTLEGVFSGIQTSVAVSNKFLGEALAVAGSSQVSIRACNEIKPVVIRRTGDEGSWLHLLVPMTVR